MKRLSRMYANAPRPSGRSTQNTHHDEGYRPSLRVLGIPAYERNGRAEPMINLVRMILSLAVPTAAVVGASAVSESTSTIDNLQAAFNGESNANARYLAFAKKADEEGYTEVASLFRAAAKAEEIHAHNHAVVIEKMGATAVPKLEPIE